MKDRPFLDLIRDFAIGGLAAAISKSLVAPLDRVKLILQNQGSNLQMKKGNVKPYKGILDVLVRLPREQGILSYWRGNLANILRYFPMQALNFSTFHFIDELLIPIMTKDPSDPRSNYYKLFRKLIAGGTAGAVGSFTIFPLTFCQTRIGLDMGSGEGKIKREFYTIPECLTKVTRSDGIRGIYRGSALTTVGTTIYRSVYFALFELGKEFLLPIYGKVSRQHSKPHLPFVIAFPLAQGATLAAGLIPYPFDTVARRLMLQSGRPLALKQYSGTFDCFKKLYEEGGIKVFYRGALSNCFRSFGGALVLVLYDEILNFVT